MEEKAKNKVRAAKGAPKTNSKSVKVPARQHSASGQRNRASKAAVKEQAPKKKEGVKKVKSKPASAKIEAVAAEAPVIKRHGKPISSGAEGRSSASKGLEVIFLGGVGEIGKNMTALRYKNDILIIDCGSSFPTTDTPGVDLIIPDFAFVAENADKVRGLVVTHGHEDHIGAIPYLAEKLPGLKIFASDLSCALIRHKLEERGIDTPKIVTVQGGDVVNAGCFSVEFIRVSHSISGAFALNINTPVGRVFHTGDYKIDFTPVDGQVMALTRIAEIGDSGVKLMLGESTNVEKPGTTIS